MHIFFYTDFTNTSVRRNMTHNDLKRTITQALDEMKKEQGDTFDLKGINLAELERRTGISRAKLRRLKSQGFVFKEHGRKGLKAKKTVLTGYEETINTFLSSAKRKIIGKCLLDKKCLTDTLSSIYTNQL